MNDLFDFFEENKKKANRETECSAERNIPPVQQPRAVKALSELPAETPPAERCVPVNATVPENRIIEGKGCPKRTALVAALLFLTPLCAAFILGHLAKLISPGQISRRNGISAEQIRSADAPAMPSDDAGVEELLEYRSLLRQRGSSTTYANIRLWAAASSENPLLFQIPPPDHGRWEWCLSQNGCHVMAVVQSDPEALFREVALYSLLSEEWLWRRKLPWPQQYEDPWIFGGNLVLRSSKNGRRFAMELDEHGSIISLDTLKTGSPFIKEGCKLPPDIPGRFIARRHGVLFASSETNVLMAYSEHRMPGLICTALSLTQRETKDIRREAHCVTGNGLLNVEASQGTIFIRDNFSGRLLERKAAWRETANTTVRGVESNLDGSKIAVHLTTSFSDQQVRRNWSVTYNPAEDIVETNTTNAPAYDAKAPALIASVPDHGIVVEARTDTLIFTQTNSAPDRSVVVSLAKHLGDEAPIASIVLLANRRHLLITGRQRSYLLDLHSVIHYGDLLDRIRHCEQILMRHSPEELTHTGISDGNLRNLPEYLRDPLSEDNFNYEMRDYYADFIDPRELEPPALPSILSLQAEFLANHQAWYYAARKLERMMKLQEIDHRAPKANPLLYTRYCLLSNDPRGAKAGCEKGLNEMFYDNSDYNTMIRWYFLRMLFD